MIGIMFKERTFDGGVVGFGAAGGKDDLARRGMDGAGNGLAGRFDCYACAGTKLMHAGSIAEFLA